MDYTYTKIDLGSAGHLYCLPIGDSTSDAIALTTNPDGGGPLYRACALKIYGVDYDVHARVQIEGGKLALERWPGGEIKRSGNGFRVSRKNWTNGKAPSAAAWTAAINLAVKAAEAYLARPEAAAARREARIQSMENRVERLDEEIEELAKKLVGLKRERDALTRQIKLER